MTRTTYTTRIFMSRTVLLVGEEQPAGGPVRHALVSRGSNVVEAEGREQAMDLLRQRIVDLILLDMSVAAGLDICRTIRTCWNIPIILVSTCQSDMDRVQALDGGADDFVSKPFSIDELLARIRVVFRRAMVDSNDPPDRDLVRLPCGHFQTEDAILSLAARISMARQEASVAAKSVIGRPRKIAICRKCGVSGGTLEMRSHRCSGNATSMIASGCG